MGEAAPARRLDKLIPIALIDDNSLDHIKIVVVCPRMSRGITPLQVTAHVASSRTEAFSMPQNATRNMNPTYGISIVFLRPIRNR